MKRGILFGPWEMVGIIFYLFFSMAGLLLPLYVESLTSALVSLVSFFLLAITLVPVFYRGTIEGYYNRAKRKNSGIVHLGNLVFVGLPIGLLKISPEIPKPTYAIVFVLSIICGCLIVRKFLKSEMKKLLKQLKFGNTFWITMVTCVGYFVSVFLPEGKQPWDTISLVYFLIPLLCARVLFEYIDAFD